MRTQSNLVLFLLFMSVTSTALLSAQNPSTTEQPDKYQWLEDVNGERSLAWVKAENQRTEKEIIGDPRFEAYQAAALKIVESPDRLPEPNITRDEIYNTWQDAQHVQGILRRTTMDDYLKPNPDWHTVLDYDALSRQDNQKWVHKGLECIYPGNSLCMVALSAGGEDATTEREFDLKTEKFVQDGFVLPNSKQGASWIDKDRVLVARNWGPGTMTTSGYPFVVKEWKRGEPLDQAKEVYRGQPSDEGTWPITLDDGSGHRAVMVIHAINFFESEYQLLTPSGTIKLGLPAKSELRGLVDGQLVFMNNQDWQPEGSATSFPQGSVLSVDLEGARKDPAHLKPEVAFAPTATEFPQEAAVTKSDIILTTLDNVQGRAYLLHREGRGWIRKKLDIANGLTVHIVSADPTSEFFFLGTTGFLTPSAYLLGDARSASLKPAKALPPQFDASNETVDQFEATSKDGTKVPYFVVRPKDLKYDGNNPTILTAYGGFQVPMTPNYSGTMGKLWLEHGGVYVLANIRGGGEFGPAWHEAGLKTHRQRIYDDFYAVAQDLVTRRITSSRRLGIAGGSNGGLLMGVEMTQHPEMWNALFIAVPLLDMLRFEKIAAGSSWVGEYGTVSKPDERAFLASISPYNQLKPDVTYPEPLIFTTTKDDRVGPVHARKFAARMQEFNKPYYYYEIIEGGHGAGADLKEQAKTAAVEYMYFTRKLMD